ncbi:DNA adenine methylase [Burkholderia ubonensis]|nr:DNA adenine methylase [Burkholderia ubonensis]
MRRVYSKPKFVKAETVPIQYTVGGGRGVERSELIIFSWDDAAEPVGLF